VTPAHHEVRRGLSGAQPGQPLVGLELDAEGIGVEVLVDARFAPDGRAAPPCPRVRPAPGRTLGAVFSIDIERGERRLVREIEPRDPVGVSGVDRILVTRDGQSYAYSYQQFFSDLFLVEGLR
jgi:hypothetical protein